MDRFETHKTASTQLEQMSDHELMGLLARSRIGERGCAPLTLPDGTTVVAKLFPLSPIETTPENRGSTPNFFGLPMRYQYRMGSAGFGAWREVEAQRMASEWVLSGECSNFPLLHHWRELAIVGAKGDKMDTAVWGDNSAILHRVAAASKASSSAVLFLEHFPQTLTEWLRLEFPRCPDPAAICIDVEAALAEILHFAGANNLLHMDVHLDNILSDGKQFYLTDFGLAISRDFDLSSEEQDFFERHQDYDRCTAINSLVHALVTHYDTRAEWREPLRELLAGTLSAVIDAMPLTVRGYLVARAPLALAYGDFYRELVADPTTPYPAARMQTILGTVWSSDTKR